MKLTTVLLRWKQRLPKGNIWRGKYRLVKPVTPLLAANRKADFALEEKNMFYLRHPYLTLEQSRGHAKPFEHHKKFIDQKKEEKIKNWKDDNLLGDRFGFLKVADKWE